MAMAAESLENTVLAEGLLNENPSTSPPLPSIMGSPSRLVPHSQNTGHQEVPGTLSTGLCVGESLY